MSDLGILRFDLHLRRIGSGRMTRRRMTTGRHARDTRMPASTTARWRIGSALWAALAMGAIACDPGAGGAQSAPEMAPEMALESTAAVPVKLTGAQIAGGVFEDFEALVETHERGDRSWTTEDVEAFVSSDQKFDAGIYRSGPVRSEIDEPYGVDEFMYFIEGGVTLTSADGSELSIGAGDAVMIPKEWRGVWDTPGYLKIYVIHYQKPLE